MLDKLKEVEDRYKELTGMLGDPEVIGDREQYAKLSKEHSTLEPIISCYREWKKTSEELEQSKELVVKIPPGANTGYQVRIEGEGERDANIPGDLYVIVYLEKHPFFERHGDDIYLQQELNFITATLGGKVEIPGSVIGDMVNLASRLEGLTKVYREPLIVSESVQDKIKDDLPTRLLDKVVVKGRLTGVGIYSVKRKLSTREENSWQLHQEGMDLYYNRQFAEAAKCFNRVLDDYPDDECAKMHFDSCDEYEKHPPAKSWNGIVEMQVK